MPASDRVRLSELHAAFSIPEVSGLEPLVRAVRDRGPQALPFDMDGKVRRNVLLAVLCEDAWCRAEESEAARPESFGLDEASRGVLLQSAAEDALKDVIRNFRAVTEKHLLACAGLDEPDDGAPAARPEHHPASPFLEDITEELRQTDIPDLQGNLRTMYPGRFRAGLVNANLMTWELIHVLPHVWVREENPLEEFSADRYQALARTNIALLRQLARAHILLFSAAHQSGRFGTVFPAFSPDFLRFDDPELPRQLCLDPQIVNFLPAYREHFVRPEIATGCPALLAKSSSGKDVVMALDQWIQRIADRHFFPHTEAIFARSDICGSGMGAQLASDAQRMIEALPQQSGQGAA